MSIIRTIIALKLETFNIFEPPGRCPMVVQLDPAIPSWKSNTKVLGRKRASHAAAMLGIRSSLKKDRKHEQKLIAI